MGRGRSFIRILLAAAALPLAFALARAAAVLFLKIPAPAAGVFSAPAFWFAVGVLAFLGWMWLGPAPVRFYVLGHELTHAAVGLLFGAKVSDLRVGLRGGSVRLTKSNVWITLAPYFVPFWTLAVAALALLTRLFVSPLPCGALWMAALGLTWCLHLCFTARSLLQDQPDIEEYGRFFSWTFIWIMNCLCVLVWITAAGVPARRTAACAGACASDAYRWTARQFVRCYESVRALPVLQK